MKASIQNNVSSFIKGVRGTAPDNLYKAVMKAGGLVKKEAQRGAPSNKVANSVGVVGKNPQGGGPESHVGVKRKSRGWYGKFFETGTDEHEIKPKNGKVLAILQVAGVAEFTNRRGNLKRLKYYRTKSGYTLDAGKAKIFFKKVDHPGMPAKPFLRPAFERSKPEIVKIVGDAINRINVQGGTLID